MKQKPPLSTIIVLALGTIMISVLGYILAPVLALPGEEPIFNATKANQTAALGATIICLVGLPILALFGLGSAWKRRKSAPIGVTLCEGAAALLFLYVPTVMGINLISWATYPKIVLWTETANFTPEEAEAGKTYLKAIQGDTQAKTPEEFQETLSPLLKLNRWGFIADDPTLYLIGGIKGEPDSKGHKWEYVLPLGTSKTMVTKILELAGADVTQGNPEAAAQKVAFVLGVGNRIGTPQTLIQALISNRLTSLGLEFLENHPDLPMTPDLKTELLGIQKNRDLVKLAFKEEHKINMKWLELTAFINGKISPYAAVTNPQVWEEFNKDWWAESKKEKGDWNQFIRNHQWEALFKAGPIQAIIVGIAVAAPNGIYERDTMTSKVDTLLEGNPSGRLNKNSSIQIAAAK